MSTEDTNNTQNEALSLLRQRIQEKRATYEAEQAQIALDPIYELPKREKQPLPEVLTPVGPFGEFSYERFMEVQKRLDVAYSNYLVVKKECTPDFEETLKELVRTVDQYVDESVRVRYS